MKPATDCTLDWTKDKLMVVAFPLTVGKPWLMVDIRKLPDMCHFGMQGGPARSKVEGKASYKLARNYMTANLEYVLDFYYRWVESKAKPKVEQIKQTEIGVALKLNKLSINDNYFRLKQDRTVSHSLIGALVKRYMT